MTPNAIILRNIRTFEGDHVLDLHESLTVVVGKNNTGKSSLLEAMYALNAAGEDGRLQALHRLELEAYGAFRFGVSTKEVLSVVPDLATHFSRITGINLSLFHELTVLFEWNGLVVILAGNDGIGVDVNFPTIKITPHGRSRVDGQIGSPAQWNALVRSVRGALLDAVASWSHFGVLPRNGENRKRLMNSEEESLRRALTFLRLSYPRQFETLEREMVATFPEFQRITFSDDAHHDTYEPQFEIRGNTNVSRSAFGAGVWAFFCILTAAHVAAATGAKFLLLDEPTLFMHPSLERRLLAVLSDRTHWPHGVLRLVAITHSRLWADVAMRQGGLRVVDWTDASAVSARIRLPERKERGAASEIVQGVPVLFVEGRSDRAALELLSREVPLACTVVSLQITDAFLSNPSSLAMLGRSAGDGFGQHARVLVDRDKEASVRKALELVGESECPRFYFAGTPTGLDLESCFCTFEFLRAFVKTQAPTNLPEGWEEQLRERLQDLGEQKSKGCDVVKWMFTKLLVNDENKTDSLAALAAHAVLFRRSDEAQAAWRNLDEVLQALDATLS